MSMNAITERTPTGSFQNQTTGSSQVPTAVTKQTRKRGIAAILQDSTNLLESVSQRPCREEGLRGNRATCAPRGNPMKGVKARKKNKRAAEKYEHVHEPSTLTDFVKNHACHVRTETDNIIGYTQRNASFEVQKAVAISIVATAITRWGCGVVEAAERAADCTGFCTKSICAWATSFMLSQYLRGSDNSSDENISDQLASDRGHCSTYMSSLFHDETFQLEARQFVRKNSCIKGQPNLTRAMFSQWVNEKYGTEISDETARSWLAKLGFKRIHHQKSVYFDGHDRDDVVLYREEFLKAMDELDKKSLTVYENTPELEEGEKSLIRVVHDESTYFANSDQSYFWGDEGTNVLKQKSLGASIMVSDFVDEVSGFVRDGEEMARVQLEPQREGYFTNDHLMRRQLTFLTVFTLNLAASSSLITRHLPL